MVTDSAAEVVKLCNFFNELGKSDSKQSVIKMISQEFSQGEIGMFIDVYKERVNELIFSIKSIDVEYVDDEVKEDALNAALSLLMVFNANRLNVPWADNMNQFMKRDVILSIRGVSPVLRQVSPVNPMGEDDLEEIKSYIDKDIASKVIDSDLPNFMKYSIVSGVERLNFVLDNYNVFGSGSVLGAAYNISKDIEVAERKEPEHANEVLGRLKTGVASAVKKIRAVNDGIDLVISVKDKAESLINNF